LNGFTQIERSSIVGNDALAAVDGGLAGSGGTVNLLDTTISGSSAASAGAMYFGSGVLNLKNVTMSGNSASGFSGGLFLAGAGTYSINNSTIAANVYPGAGSNINLSSSAVVTVGNSIIAAGVGGANCFFGSGTSLISAGYNLDDGTSCGLAGTGDQSSATANLGPLADNGGPTWTHALLSGSAAVDAGDPGVPSSCEEKDQRGAPRPADGDGDLTPVCDVGAFEVVATADLRIDKSDGTATAVPGAASVYSIQVANAGPDDVVGTTVTDALDPGVFEVAGATWTCTVGGGSAATICPASGTGADLAAGVQVDIAAGDSLKIELTAVVLPEATGTADNTAGVSGASFDADPSDDSSPDSNTLTPQADLSISKDDGVTAAVPGGQVVYTVTVANAGPSDAPATAVSDSFPPALSCSWTCTGNLGGSFTAGPVAGDLIDSPDVRGWQRRLHGNLRHLRCGEWEPGEYRDGGGTWRCDRHRSRQQLGNRYRYSDAASRSRDQQGQRQQ